MFNGADGIDWRTTVYPPDRKSSVAYAPDPADAGDCSGGSTDVSSRNSHHQPGGHDAEGHAAPRG